MSFAEISPYDITQNPFDAIGRQWMLASAGTEEAFNTMTVSWGQLGIMWNLPVANAYIRPQRYTRQFAEAQTHFTLTLLDGEQYRPALNLLGTKSGRDGDKVAESGLHPVFLDGHPAFEEASLVLVCRKLYTADLTADGFADKGIVPQHYAAGDFHRMYVGEIEKVYQKS